MRSTPRSRGADVPIHRFFRFFCRGRRPRRPDQLNLPLFTTCGTGFCYRNPNNMQRYSQKFRPLSIRQSLLIFSFSIGFYQPSPYPLPQGEGFKTFGRGRRRCEAHQVLRGADVPRAMVKNTHSAFLPWMGRFRTCPYVMF